jgi:hypothetical protein
MDMDMSDNEEEEQYFAGYYNIWFNDMIVHTEYFLLEEYEEESYIIKQIRRKHKEDVKQFGKSNYAIEIFDERTYPINENINEIKEVLDDELEIQKDMISKLSNQEKEQRKEKFLNMDTMFSALDSIF